MNINDILTEKFGIDFGEVDKYLTEEMYSTAGEKLVEEMERVLGNEDKAKDWYFSEIPGLEYKRPYDHCKEDSKKGRRKIRETLARIEHGFPG